jgi:Tfp pilus assembly PilM family ATPase
MTNRILGIEISAQTTKIIEVSPARRVKLFNFAVIENASVDPARRVEQIQHTLRSRGFESRNAFVAISGAGTEHRLLTLPVLSDREMHFVMTREAKKLGGAESVWAYERLKTKEELGVQKDQILLVSTDQTVVNDVLKFLTLANINVGQITTIPEAILNLMRQSGIVRNDSVKLVVHVSGARAHVLFIEGGSLMLTRDFPLDYDGIARNEQVSRLLTEMKRSILFFKQNFPQAQVQEIVYSGDSEMTATLSTESRYELGMETSVMKFDDMLDSSGFRGDFSEFRHHIPAMAAAIGAAWRKTPAAGINLVPGRKPAPRAATTGLDRLANAAAGIAILILLAAVTFFYLQSSSVRGALAVMRLREAEVRPKAEQAAAAREVRALAAAREAIIESTRPAADWLEVFRGLSLVVPESAVFDSVHIETNPNAVLTIRGQMLAASAAQANADFNAFFTRLRGMPSFSNIAMSRPLTVANETELVAAAATPGPRSRLSFEVKCELSPNN